jgi:hypothetical protein
VQALDDLGPGDPEDLVAALELGTAEVLRGQALFCSQVPVAPS